MRIHLRKTYNIRKIDLKIFVRYAIFSLFEPQSFADHNLYKFARFDIRKPDVHILRVLCVNMNKYKLGENRKYLYYCWV